MGVRIPRYSLWSLLVVVTVVAFAAAALRITVVRLIVLSIVLMIVGFAILGVPSIIYFTARDQFRLSRWRAVVVALAGGGFVHLGCIAAMATNDGISAAPAMGSILGFFWLLQSPLVVYDMWVTKGT